LRERVNNLVIGGSSQDATILRKHILSVNNETSHIISRSVDKLCKYSNEVHFESLFNDFEIIIYLISNYQYENIYIFTAQSSVFESFKKPSLTFYLNCDLPNQVFAECMKHENEGKILVPLSSECFGSSLIPCSSNTAFKPISPYGVSKAILRDVAVDYREKGLKIDLPILFNHESMYRASFSVIRKFMDFLRKVMEMKSINLNVGNLDVIRDWSHAVEITTAMYDISRLPGSHDACLGSGRSFSIRELISFMEDITGTDIQDYLFVSQDYLRENDIASSFCDVNEAEKLNIRMPVLNGHSLIKKLIEDFDVI
jgi:GDPmannose 4,6-dehydratase